MLLPRVSQEDKIKNFRGSRPASESSPLPSIASSCRQTSGDPFLWTPSSAFFPSCLLLWHLCRFLLATSLWQPLAHTRFRRRRNRARPSSRSSFRLHQLRPDSLLGTWPYASYFINRALPNLAATTCHSFHALALRVSFCGTSHDSYQLPFLPIGLSA